MKIIQSFLKIPDQSTNVSISLLLTRLIVGVAFIIHGAQKIQYPFNWAGPESTIPNWLQFLATIAEFGGGIALLLGLLTPIASFGIACVMAAAAYVIVTTLKAPFVSLTGGISYELNLVYLATAVLFIVMGPGKFSLDNLLFGKRMKTEDVMQR